MKRAPAVIALALVILLLGASGCFRISRGNTTAGTMDQPSPSPSVNTTHAPTTAVIRSSATAATVPSVTVSCTAPYISCGGGCIHPGLDNANCGKCGVTCSAGYSCFSGVCTLSCKEGETLCSGACRDISSDAANCGSCGTSCMKGQSCNGGICISSCPEGQTMCTTSAFGGAAVCVNTLTDPSHCGTCTNACPGGWRCSGGKCVATAYVVVTTVTKASSPAAIGHILRPICKSGMTLCGGTCVDLKTDTGNCGSCNNSCAKGKYCVSGYCIDTIY